MNDQGIKDPDVEVVEVVEDDDGYEDLSNQPYNSDG